MVQLVFNSKTLIISYKNKIMETIEIIKDVIEDVLNTYFIDESDYQEEDRECFYYLHTYGKVKVMKNPKILK